LHPIEKDYGGNIHIEFFEHLTSLFEIYINKTDKNIEILYFSMELMFSEIQINNFYMLSVHHKHKPILLTENYCFLSLLQISTYFVNENIKQYFNANSSSPRVGESSYKLNVIERNSIMINGISPMHKKSGTKYTRRLTVAPQFNNNFSI